jgi:hypothetical protein
MEAGKHPDNPLIWQGGLENEHDPFPITTTKAAWLKFRKEKVQSGYSEQAREDIFAHLDSLTTWIDGFGPDILEILDHSCTQEFLRELRYAKLAEWLTIKALQGMCPSMKLPCFMILDAVACGVPAGCVLPWSNAYISADLMVQDARLSWKRLREAFTSASGGKIDIRERSRTLCTEAFRLGLARYRGGYKLSAAEKELASAKRN